MQSRQYINEVFLSGVIDKGSYLNALPIIQYLIEYKRLSFSNRMTLFVGENGTGKSTLLEAIAVAYGFNAEGGTKNFKFSTNDSHSELYKYVTLSKSMYAKDSFFLRAESFYNVASYIDEVDAKGSYGGLSMHQQSHGESFLALVQNRFRGNGLYILDEPEAALSPMRQLTLIVELDKLIKNNSQIIIATHSPILMAYPDAEILEFTEKGIQRVDFRETEHYQVTKALMDAPENMMHHLLKN